MLDMSVEGLGVGGIRVVEFESQHRQKNATSCSATQTMNSHSRIGKSGTTSKTNLSSTNSEKCSSCYGSDDNW